MIDSVLGRPEGIRRLGEGVLALSYGSRGVSLIYSEGDSLAVIHLDTREAGDIGGVRVGDAREAVIARWGNPTGGEGQVGLYEVGRWVIIVQLDAKFERVELLGIGRLADGP